MATTAIWAINGNISGVLAYVGDRDKTGNREFEAELQSLKDVMDYAVNPTKTEKQFYVSGINCDPAIARDQMLITKKRFGKLDGRSAYHGYQSFKPGETTPDIAHEIGLKFAERMWGEEYQVVVATHVDKAHIHNHFVINSVSFVSGRKYHSSCRSYFGKMRVISDELCEEYGLSVVEPVAGEGRRTKQYREWLDEKEGRQTWRGLVRQDIDHALSISSSWPQFLLALKAQGYEVKTGVKYMAVRPPGKERFIRLRSLGDGYAEESLGQRIQSNRHPQRTSPAPERLPEKRRCRGGWNGSKRIKLKGFRALYFRYMYMMGILRKRPRPGRRTHFLLREDLLKLDRITDGFKLPHMHEIETLAELDAYRDAVSERIGALLSERKALNARKRRAKGGNESQSLSEKSASITMQLKECRKELKLCADIEERSRAMAGRLEEIRREGRDAENERKIKLQNRERS